MGYGDCNYFGFHCRIHSYCIGNRYLYQQDCGRASDGGCLLDIVLHGIWSLPRERFSLRTDSRRDLSTYATDNSFWFLLAYCAGIGGSMLIIGSAAGVVVMGLQRISFAWYLRHFSWIACLGYLAGILAFWLQELFWLASPCNEMI